MIIGISGKIGSGKDTVGLIIQYLTHGDNMSYSSFLLLNYDQDAFNWKIKKFADKLKECISIITGISREDLEKIEVKNSNLPEAWNRTPIIEDIYGVKYTSPIPLPLVSMTVRTLLQEFGTEVGRMIHPNFWVNALFVDYKRRASSEIIISKLDENNDDFRIGKFPDFPNWIITDMRFPNELEKVKAFGGITIRVERDNPRMQSVEQTNHPSETALDGANFKYTIDNNGSIEELIEKVKEILIKEGII